MSEHEAAVEQVSPLLRQELDLDALIGIRAKVQEILNKVFVVDVHYGVIPGTGGKKNALLQPGAEVLALAFRMAPQYTMKADWNHDATRNWERTDKYNNRRSGQTRGFVRVEVLCNMVHAPSGVTVGAGVGVCNSWEKKYETQDPYNSEETVAQIARKRAMVNAIRTATASSDMFTQDEDLIPGDPESPPAASPRATRPAPAPKAPKPAPDAPQATASGGRLHLDIPPFCPKCGGDCWDNTKDRETDSKKAGWRCKDKTCKDIKNPKYGPAWWRSDPNEDTDTYDRYAADPNTYLARWIAEQGTKATAKSAPAAPDNSAPPYPDFQTCWDAVSALFPGDGKDAFTTRFYRIVDAVIGPGADPAKDGSTAEQYARIVEMAQTEADESPFDELNRQAKEIF